MNLGKKISLILKEKNISPIDLASSLNLTRSAIYKILARPNIDTLLLEKIANFLDVPIITFFPDNEKVQSIITERNNHILVLVYARKEIDKTIQLLSLIQNILKDKKCNSVIEEKYKTLVTNIKNFFIENDFGIDGLKKIDYDNTILENIINIIDDLKDTRKLIDENIDEKYKVKPQ